MGYQIIAVSILITFGSFCLLRAFSRVMLVVRIGIVLLYKIPAL